MNDVIIEAELWLIPKFIVHHRRFATLEAVASLGDTSIQPCGI